MIKLQNLPLYAFTFSGTGVFILSFIASKNYKALIYAQICFLFYNLIQIMFFYTLCKLETDRKKKVAYRREMFIFCIFLISACYAIYAQISA